MAKKKRSKNKANKQAATGSKNKPVKAVKNAVPQAEVNPAQLLKLDQYRRLRLMPLIEIVAQSLLECDKSLASSQCAGLTQIARKSKFKGIEQYIKARAGRELKIVESSKEKLKLPFLTLKNFVDGKGCNLRSELKKKAMDAGVSKNKSKDVADLGCDLVIAEFIQAIVIEYQYLLEVREFNKKRSQSVCETN